MKEASILPPPGPAPTAARSSGGQLEADDMLAAPVISPDRLCCVACSDCCCACAWSPIRPPARGRRWAWRCRRWHRLRQQRMRRCRPRCRAMTACHRTLQCSYPTRPGARMQPIAASWVAATACSTAVSPCRPCLRCPRACPVTRRCPPPGPRGAAARCPNNRFDLPSPER